MRTKGPRLAASLVVVGAFLDDSSTTQELNPSATQPSAKETAVFQRSKL